MSRGPQCLGLEGPFRLGPECPGPQYPGLESPSTVKKYLCFFNRRMSHGDNVKDEVLVPSFDKDVTVLGVEAAMKFRF